jgi:hypothetical protein
MNWNKIVMTVFALIAGYLILSKGEAFNNVLKTSASAVNTGVALLQGRDKVAGVTQ